MREVEENRKFNPLVSYDEDGNEVLDWKLTVIYPVIVAAILIILVIAKGLLHPTWVIVLTIPVHDSLVKAIIHKNPYEFWIWMLAAAAYLMVGFLSGAWIWGALIFISIPIYYAAVFLIRKFLFGGKK